MRLKCQASSIIEIVIFFCLLLIAILLFFLLVAYLSPVLMLEKLLNQKILDTILQCHKKWKGLIAALTLFFEERESNLKTVWTQFSYHRNTCLSPVLMLEKLLNQKILDTILQCHKKWKGLIEALTLFFEERESNLKTVWTQFSFRRNTLWWSWDKKFVVNSTQTQNKWTWYLRKY